MSVEIKPVTFIDLPKKPVYKDSPDITVFLVTEGSLVIDVGLEQRKVGVDKIFFIGAKMIFAAWSLQKKFSGYQIKIPLKLWNKYATKEYEFMLFPSDPLIKEIMAYPFKNSDFNLLCAPLVIKVLSDQMQARCFPQGSSFKPLSFFMHSTLDERILRACQLIISQYNDPDLSIDALAKASGISARNMQRLFLNELGFTPTDALKKVRIENALYHLAGSRYNLSEIGLEIGYQSHSQFVKAFKSLMGVTPSSYKR